MHSVSIGYDREESTELEPKYFVYETTGLRLVIYKGTYTQCLVVFGALMREPDATIAEIRSKCNGFI